MLAQLKRYLRTLSLRAALWASDVRTAHGVKIVALSGDQAQCDIVTARIDEALSMLRRTHPAIYARATRHLAVFAAIRLHGRVGEYVHELNTCLIDTEYASSSTVGPVQIAIIIGHEASHARVRAAGIPFCETTSTRIERGAIRSEISLLMRLPERVDLLAWATERMTRIRRRTQSGENVDQTRGQVRLDEI
jgi:hypothetical protein